MPKHARRAVFVVLGTAALLAACGTERHPTPTPTPPDLRYLPLVAGASWTYRVVNGTTGVLTTKRSVVEPAEAMQGAKAGVVAYPVLTTRAGGATRSWQEDLGSSIVRHFEREQDETGRTESESLYEPRRLRLDESPGHLLPGATWIEEYVETRIDLPEGTTESVEKSDRWVVEAVDEPVTVPAGLFHCLRVTRTRSVTGEERSEKTYWFARGVGKVKEMGGQTEELESFVIPEPEPDPE